MNNEELNDLLVQRDQVIATSEEFSEIGISTIENEEIRELGRIVLENSDQSCTVFSCT